MKITLGCSGGKKPRKPRPLKGKWLFYAVGFEAWSAAGESLRMDGQTAKVGGPFDTPESAWESALALHEGASMMCDFPFIFKVKKPLDLDLLARAIDDEKFEVKEEYRMPHQIHSIRFKTRVQAKGEPDA